MASNLLLRSATRVAGQWSAAAGQRNLSVSAVQAKNYVMNDPIEHATGLEKFELMARQQGNDNPFDMYTIKPEPHQGTAKTPIVIPSTKASRMVGCCCENDYKEVVWFELTKGAGTQKCDCGYHFKLIDYDPLDKSVRPVYGHGFGSNLSTFLY